MGNPLSEDEVYKIVLENKKISTDYQQEIQNLRNIYNKIDDMPQLSTDDNFDITEKEIFYIILDICTISVMLNKPLTCRLMPIPGKVSGDDVEFDFEYFASSKIIEFRRLVDDDSNDLFNRNEKNLKFL